MIELAEKKGIDVSGIKKTRELYEAAIKTENNARNQYLDAKDAEKRETYSKIALEASQVRKKLSKLLSKETKPIEAALQDQRDRRADYKAVSERVSELMESILKDNPILKSLELLNVLRYKHEEDKALVELVKSHTQDELRAKMSYMSEKDLKELKRILDMI